jgi:type 1 glutamine amidotransferase
MANHPVIRGLGPLPVVDEAYLGMWHADGIRVLPVVYLGPNPSQRAIYIQLGHSAGTMRHPGYRKVVRNAILWSAGRLQ